jgi:putative tryptophan/tyrosine transport system substrate-binding protein
VNYATFDEFKCAIICLPAGKHHLNEGCMRRRDFLGLMASVTATWPFTALAQQQSKFRHIGYLDYGAGILPNGEFAPFYDKYRRKQFLEGLRDRGWVEGQNVTIERRFAAGQADRLAALAAELVALKVEVIVAAATPSAMAARNATSNIAIVMVDPGDAVALGLVASVARPGANVTGVTSLAPELATKRLGLLKEAFPKIARVAVLWNSAIPPAEVALNELRTAAPMLGLELQLMEVKAAAGLPDALDTLKRERADALFVFPDPLMFGSRNSIVSFANKNSIPALFGAREFVEAGGLMSYGSDYPAMFRRAGNYVARILNGESPADLPVEMPTKFALIINLKTAKAFGFDIAPMLLAHADEVIE